MGFFSYFRAYIGQFAEIAKPLTDLTKRPIQGPAQWTEVHQEAFNKLKNCLCDATKLHIISYGDPCGILVDSSSSAVGCCLIQWTHAGKEKPIAYASSKLTPTQTAWSTIEREAYAVTFALRKFRNFVFAAKIVVFSDHNHLLYLRECAPKSAKLTRWALGLNEFDYEILSPVWVNFALPICVQLLVTSWLIHPTTVDVLERSDTTLYWWFVTERRLLSVINPD